MKHIPSSHHSHHELRACAVFYAFALGGMIVLHTLVALLLSSAWLREHDGLLWTASFLVSCWVCAWGFERNHHRRRQ
jgi:hypothetical protein